ncbi:uncharacterized protein LOC143631849 [Bidens hawaiensis]|uniref:uncharacterized protein LOC143631849 n=1 Tax=Bidens hawaiensis TaxID=980011 RepID=UPI00404ACF27
MVGFASSTSNGEATITTTAAAVPEKSTAAATSDRNRYIGRSVYWSPEEQSLLEKLLPRYASYNLVQRYAKIAVKLHGEKTIYDVALRVRWMNGKAVCQQVKPSSDASNHSNGLDHAPLSSSIDNDDDTDDDESYKAIGGTAVHLLEQINQAMNHFDANITTFTVNKTTYVIKKYNFCDKFLTRPFGHLCYG